ncbi:hypothetical protein [Jejuia pallidilutea]|uniref:Conserved domain protein n=1 Tax=Jejuia pallidilutea TaxID=504487 RepID=A0A090W6L9_9FLAO|nr:conserved domain protein [Jejuia pallidilutea]
MIYSSDIRLIVRSTKDSLASLSIEKTSEGSSYQIAKQRAEQINYNYALVGKELLLDAYLTTDFKHKFRDQEVHLILYLPEGSTYMPMITHTRFTETHQITTIFYKTDKKSTT